MAKRLSSSEKLVLQYQDKLKVSVTEAMSRCWSTGFPNYIGIDVVSEEPLQVWGLTVERRRPEPYHKTFYSSFRDFQRSIGRFYHQYTDEVFYTRFIDIRARLWYAATQDDGHYPGKSVGNLRQFHPEESDIWEDLSNWDAILRNP